jgi:hypothetical protein
VIVEIHLVHEEKLHPTLGLLSFSKNGRSLKGKEFIKES